jgi:hypothetical protein
MKTDIEQDGRGVDAFSFGPMNKSLDNTEDSIYRRAKREEDHATKEDRAVEKR